MMLKNWQQIWQWMSYPSIHYERGKRMQGGGWYEWMKDIMVLPCLAGSPLIPLRLSLILPMAAYTKWHPQRYKSFSFFSQGKQMFLLHRITYLSKLFNQGQGSWYYDKNTKLQENNWSVCSKFDPLTPAHCNCEKHPFLYNKPENPRNLCAEKACIKEYLPIWVISFFHILCLHSVKLPLQSR